MNKSKDLIETRAFALDCVVIEIHPFTGVVLCKKNTERENAFITWKYYVENNEAHFYWGHYDMSLNDGATSYSDRVNEGLGKGATVSPESETTRIKLNWSREARESAMLKKGAL